MGSKNKLIVLKGHSLEPSQSLSSYYPSFDKYVDFLGTAEAVHTLADLTKMKSFYDTHLTQLPAVHFAYRYFYNELTEVCLMFSNPVAAMGYKKAYEGYEGNVLPAPEGFQSIEAVFLEPVLPYAIEEENMEAPSKKQPASSEKSEPTKSKKKQKIKSENDQTSSSSSSSSSSSTSSSIADTEAEKVTVKLDRDSLPFEELVYDPRVSLWFTNPEDCLSLPSYTNLSEETKKIALYKHAFPNALDQLLGTAYSVQETYQNSTQNQVDIQFSIPGEIEFVNGKKVRGLFQYCFGANDKVCYHRYFKEMGTRDLLNSDQYAIAFEEIEFPPLSLQRLTPATQAKINVDLELVHEPHLNTYAVKDGSKGLIFRAFKTRDLA